MALISRKAVRLFTFECLDAFERQASRVSKAFIDKAFSDCEDAA